MKSGLSDGVLVGDYWMIKVEYEDLRELADSLEQARPNCQSRMGLCFQTWPLSRRSSCFRTNKESSWVKDQYAVGKKQIKIL